MKPISLPYFSSAAGEIIAVARMRQNIDKGEERLFQRNLHRRRIDDFGFIDILIQVVTFQMVSRLLARSRLALPHRHLKSVPS